MQAGGRDGGAPLRARRARGENRDLIDAAELMASELTSNCVRHAGTGFDVSVSVGEQIRVDVRDSGGGRPRPLSPDRPSRRAAA